MRIRKELGLAIAIAAMAMPGTAWAQGTRLSYTPPKQLALRLSDLPAGFKANTAISFKGTSASAAQTSAQLFQGQGQIAGFETVFTRSTFMGLIEAVNIVEVYKGPAEARLQLEMAQRNLKHTYLGIKFTDMHVGGIGQQSLGFTFSMKQSGLRIKDYAILFREGRYSGFLEGVGLKGNLDASSVVRLAQVVAMRCSKAR